MKALKSLLVTAATLGIMATGPAFGSKTTSQAVVSVTSNLDNYIIKLSGTPYNPAGCTYTGYQIPISDNRKDWLAQLLTAKAGGINVKLSVSDTLCNGDNPLVTAVILE